MFTVFLKSSKSNVLLSVTNSDKLILPNKQLPPEGSGSSAPHTIRIIHISYRALDYRILVKL